MGVPGRVAPGTADWRDLREEVLHNMKKSAAYYRGKVASHGGYVYYYSTDLKERWGEGKAGTGTIFVQPPGTPTVGMAYLKAYAATSDPFYLDAVRETAEALVHGQLQSGGWTQVIHFAKPEKGRMGWYRKNRAGSWNFSSLDDDQTQAALRSSSARTRPSTSSTPTFTRPSAMGWTRCSRPNFPTAAFLRAGRSPSRSTPCSKPRFPPTIGGPQAR